MPAPARAFSVFLHCRGSDCSHRSLFCISPLPQQWLLPQEPFLYFPTAAAVTAPAGALSIFSLCRSSVCSRRSPVYIFPTATAVSAPAGALSIFSHCRSSVRSRRSPVYISPLPQKCPLSQEPCLYFPTAAVVSAPAGGSLHVPHCRSSVCSRRSPVFISPLPQHCLLPQEPCLYFPTAVAVSSPAGALSIFPHCRSSLCSRWSLIYISPLISTFHCHSTTRFHRSHFLYSDAAEVPASTGALSIFPQCRSSVCSRRSLLCISTLSSTRFRRSRFSPFRCCNGAVTTSGVQHPFSSNQCKFWGLSSPALAAVPR